MSRVARTIAAEPDQVCYAFTNSTALREWLADLALATPEKGGRLYLAWNDGTYIAGSFRRLTDRRLSWQVDGKAQAVDIKWKPVSEGTIVTIEDPSKGRRRFWKRSLENLASVLETGEDLRITRRPMLGVLLDGPVNAEQNARLGLGTDRGILLDNVVEGMGAAAAFRKGDVLTRLGGKKLTSWSSIGVALSGHLAGDAVEIEFFRDGRREVAELPLSGRPTRQVPLDRSGLVDLAVRTYATAETTLRSLFENRSEEEANRRREPEAWNAKEVVAHLLIGEQYQQLWVVSLVAGGEPFYDGDYGNSMLQVSSVAASHPSAGSLVDEFCRAQNATLAMLGGLPELFVGSRRSMWRLGWSYLDAPDHNQGHFEQVHSALSA
jgi:uncharacterized protein YndB with AHSA1/START domain